MEGPPWSLASAVNTGAKHVAAIGSAAAGFVGFTAPRPATGIRHWTGVTVITAGATKVGAIQFPGSVLAALRVRRAARAAAAGLSSPARTAVVAAVAFVHEAIAGREAGLVCAANGIREGAACFRVALAAADTVRSAARVAANTAVWATGAVPHASL